MKILNLVLYSENEPAYVAMRDVLRAHTARYPNVRCVFYIYDPTITEPWILDGDTLRIRGHESRIPGILNKTIEAFRITAEWEYDLLIRTNISTVVDFNRIIGYCNNAAFIYGGPSSVVPANVIDKKAGIFDCRYSGMTAVWGWCIIFSRAIVKQMINDSHFIDTSVIDDIAINDYLNRKRHITPTNLMFACCRDTLHYDSTKCVFRNFTLGDRMADVERMRDITSKIHP